MNLYIVAVKVCREAIKGQSGGKGESNLHTV